MECSVGQRVYIRRNFNNFKFSSYTGEVVYIDHFKGRVSVRFSNDETALFFEKDISLTFIFPFISPKITVAILISFLILVFANVLNLYIFKLLSVLSLRTSILTWLISSILILINNSL